MMEAASSVEDAMDAIGGRQKGVKGVFSCFFLFVIGDLSFDLPGFRLT